jgi:pimeloyl-ACP methyl ester carboxylesterase
MAAYTEHTFSGTHVDINYAESDGDGPALVIAHGFSGRWQGHIPYMDLLDDWHVYAVDQAGHGKSGTRDGTYKLVDFADDMAEFLEGVTGAGTAYIGLSLGGLVGMTVAGSHPELIKTLVTGDVPYLLFAENYRGSWLHNYRADTREQLDVGIDVEAETKKQAEANPTWTQEQARVQAVSLSQVRPETADALADGTFADGWDTDSMFDRTTAAVFMLQGDDQNGGFKPDSDVTVMLERYSEAKAVKFYGLSHSLDYRSPDAPFSVLKNFLEERHLA